MKVLITGGAGYIGNAIAQVLLDRGHTPIVLDNLATGKRELAQRPGIIFHEGDIADRALVCRILDEHPDLRTVIHCAALIVVPESTMRPADYYRENVAKSVDLFETLAQRGGMNVVFSSSASIYGSVPGFRADESAPLEPSSPYARTKFMMEMILADFCAAYDLSGLSLRYFNPIGADPQARTGGYIENPSHVLARLVAAASEPGATFTITGTDWPTRDGSGIRDYIHVADLARAHLLAAEAVERPGFFAGPGGAGDGAASSRAGSGAATGTSAPRYTTINLGTGNGVTVKELVEAFRNVWPQPVNVTTGPPRPGDVAGAYADTTRAKLLLGWECEFSIEDAIRHEFAWRKRRREVWGY